MADPTYWKNQKFAWDGDVDKANEIIFGHHGFR